MMRVKLIQIAPCAVLSFLPVLLACSSPQSVDDTGMNSLNVPLTMSPTSYTLAIGKAVVLGVSGGSPPYTFALVGGGTGLVQTGLNAAVFTATTDSGNIQIQVSDTAGTQMTSILSLTTASGTPNGTNATPCQGMFSLLVGTASGILNLSQNGSSISGTLLWPGSGVSETLTGTCSPTDIQFVTQSAQSWTGKIFLDQSNSLKVFLSGTYGSSGWFASNN
ncbi:MAG: hypothetical protein C5B49_10840 [Bdellovibrio sp.]|nr:MAG: hypothetical protein C5B49_10840 [Bdellovibrio sp.]